MNNSHIDRNGNKAYEVGDYYADFEVCDACGFGWGLHCGFDCPAPYISTFKPSGPPSTQSMNNPPTTCNSSPPSTKRYPPNYSPVAKSVPPPPPVPKKEQSHICPCGMTRSMCTYHKE